MTWGELAGAAVPVLLALCGAAWAFVRNEVTAVRRELMAEVETLDRFSAAQYAPLRELAELRRDLAVVAAKLDDVRHDLRSMMGRPDGMAE